MSKQLSTAGSRFVVARVCTTLAIAIAVIVGGAAGASAAAAPSPKEPAVAPVDPALAASADRLDHIQKLRDAAAATPQRYGGVATAGDSNVTLCDNGGPANAQADAPVAALKASGARVSVQPCKHTLAELNAVLVAVPLSKVFADNQVTLTRWGINYENNAVEIGVDSAPAALFDAVGSLWGDAAYLIVKRSHEFQAGSRTTDFPPYFGGDLIGGAAGTCTSGFALRDLWGGNFAITAGHCYPLNDNVWANGSIMGQVKYRTLSGGQNDAELIGGSPYAGKIWVGGPMGSGNSWLPVHQAQNSCTGCLVYENGAFTGQTLVQLWGGPYCDNIGGIVSCNVQDAVATGSSAACTHGDSGNPVFAYDGRGGVTAVGIHHSGADDLLCSYTQVPPILAFWHATIATA